MTSPPSPLSITKNDLPPAHFNKSAWLFLALAVVSLAYIVGLLILQLTAPADGYSAPFDRLSPQGLTIREVLLERPHGLQAGDVIIAAGGKTVEEWLAITFERGPIGETPWQVGQIIPYTVIRNGEKLTIPIQLERLPLWTVFSRWAVAALITLATAAIGLFVFLKKPRDRAARALLLMSLGFAIQVNSVDISGIQLSDFVNRRVFWGYLFPDIPGWILFLAALVHFTLVFPTPRRVMTRRFVLSLLYIVPLVGVVALALGLGVTWTERILWAAQLNNWVALVFLIFASFNMVYSYRTAQTAIARSQMRWIVWGGSMPIAIWLTLYVLPALVWGRAWLPANAAVIPFILTPIALAFAIIRYRLMDIDRVINRSLVYLILTALLGSLYFLLVAISGVLLQWVGLTAAHEGRLFLSVMLIVALFDPLRSRVQSLIDHAFYRNTLNFRSLLEDLSQELALTINFAELVPLLTDAIPYSLNIASADLLALDDRSQTLYSEKSDLTLALDHPLVQYLLTTKHALVIAPADASSSSSPVAQPLQAYGVALCLPLIVGNHLVGLYLFGPKRSLEFYTREEISFLTTLGHQAAIAIENARLYKQIAEQERMKHELEIAHQIQLDLLPQSDPDVAGFEIVGYSRPAQKVGGDFYAYYYLPEGRLGIAVGDVSGKGLPGALYMAISASVLETHAPFYTRVGELLDVVDRALSPRMQARGMNIGLAYLLLDPARREIQVSNAGLISPLLLRCRETARYLEPNSIPLGVLIDDRRSESVLYPQPGDVLLLVSDGIVEAKNEENQLYGFERFESLVSSFQTGVKARDILDRLLADVQQFMNGAEQHDDMTVVVIKVR